MTLISCEYEVYMCRDNESKTDFLNFNTPLTQVTISNIPIEKLANDV